MLELLALGLVITIEPLPVIGFILVLSTDRGLRNGAAFIAGWLVTLVAIVVATVTLTGGTPPEHNTLPATAIAAANILIGLFLLGVALRVQRRPKDVPRPTPSWVKRVDGLKPGGAAVLGFLLQPWGLVAAGAAAVTQADVSQATSIAALVAFCVVATLSLAAMQIYSMRSPEESREALERLRSWLDRHRDEGIVILSAVVGAWLVGQGIYTLAT